jgi:hypothetical protein
VAGALVGPAAADAAYPASWYMTKAQAERAARGITAREYDVYDASAWCRPQGANRPRPGYVYHRWVCGVSADASLSDCESGYAGGQLLVAGSRHRDYTNWRWIRGVTCE